MGKSRESDTHRRVKWKYFEHSDTLMTDDGSGDDLLKFDGKTKNESLVIPPPSVTGPHDLKRESLDLGVSGSV